MGGLAARLLGELGCCEIEEGLSEEEFARVEREYGFEFADDHRAFLAVGLPVRQEWEEGQMWEEPWPDWRNGDPEALRRHVDWPVEFLLSDVERGHWRSGWGERPGDPVEAVEMARVLLAGVPRMVPVYAHRFLPAGRGTRGHPVLSMRGRDIVPYGIDLVDYIGREFGESRDREWRAKVTVPFWREYVRDHL